MAKGIEKSEQSGPSGPSEYVRVRVHSAVSEGGVVLRPKVDGGRKTPVEAVVPRELAKRHGPAVLEILGDAEAPDAKETSTGEPTA